MDPRFARHFAAAHALVLPAGRLPLTIGDVGVGWVEPRLSRALAACDGVDVTPLGVRLDGPERLGPLWQRLVAEGHGRVRGEAFDVRGEPDGPVLGQIDRGALPVLGIVSVGVHVNGLVRRADGVHVWVGHRSLTKKLDPGKLDHIVAGGVSAGMTAAETLVKEAAEEASMPEQIARQAAHVGVIRYALLRAEGLRRDVLHCFDLDLPESFVPVPADDEVARFELWPVDRLARAVRDTDDVKFNVNYVLIDLFRRLAARGELSPEFDVS